MYTILTTCPDYGSQNVGDGLIEQATKRIVSRETGVHEFLTIFREECLEPRLAEINASRAILMPAFPIRDTPMYPGTYRLLDDLDRIHVPMIPIGANWNVYPGDAQSRKDVTYSQDTVDFLQRVAAQVERLSCREYYVCQVLRKHGIHNALMTGDPAWFHLPSLGKPMRRSPTVERVAFSPPLSPFYVDQAEQMLRMLALLFAHAEKYCAMHLADAGQNATAAARSENSAAMSPAVAEKNRRIRELANELGFEVREMAGDLQTLELYDTCDLHVGYECHAHLNFLSKRIPSVLLSEDARGVGFNYSLGVGGFDGFVRVPGTSGVPRKAVTSGYCTSLVEFALAPARNDVHEQVRQFLVEEVESAFRRYVGLAAYLDDVYQEGMRPFIRSLP